MKKQLFKLGADHRIISFWSVRIYVCVLVVLLLLICAAFYACVTSSSFVPVECAICSTLLAPLGAVASCPLQKPHIKQPQTPKTTDIRPAQTIILDLNTTEAQWRTYPNRSYLLIWTREGWFGFDGLQPSIGWGRWSATPTLLQHRCNLHSFDFDSLQHKIACRWPSASQHRLTLTVCNRKSFDFDGLQPKIAWLWRSAAPNRLMLTVCSSKSFDFDGLQPKIAWLWRSATPTCLTFRVCNPTSLEFDGLQPQIAWLRWFATQNQLTLTECIPKSLDFWWYATPNRLILTVRNSKLYFSLALTSKITSAFVPSFPAS